MTPPRSWHALPGCGDGPQPAITRRRGLAALMAALMAAPAAGLAACHGPALAPTPVAGPVPRVRFGRLERWAPFVSRHVPARPVEVWLPPGYDGRRPHAVLYMHDGQMLFDASTTWNRQAWAVDQVAAPLLAQGRLRPFIVVGPWNGGPRRFAEYFPQAWWPLLPAAMQQQLARRNLPGAAHATAGPSSAAAGHPEHGHPDSDAYLRFLVEELKPAVDTRYATQPGRGDTLLAGSSMGGLISLYGLCERPDVFGGAACISTHWIGSFERNTVVPDAALAYLRQRLPRPDQVRLWMDRGTQELDALYDHAQARVDALMAERGFGPPAFRSVVHTGSGHNETDWQRQLAGPLLHLLGTAGG